jgi:dCTP deaminase
MILSDGEIEEALDKKLIIIDPRPSAERYRGSSVDLTLGRELFRLIEPATLQEEEPSGVARPIEIDPSNLKMEDFLRKYARRVDPHPDGYFRLDRNDFRLTITNERVELPKESKIAARVEGRSTLARLGLAVHMTAPTIHCGFRGNIVLEIFNFGPYPLRLRPGLEICQLILERTRKIPKSEHATAFMQQRSVIPQRNRS